MEGIDNTVTVDVFPLNTMTQAQLDLQTQLEQATRTDLTTKPLLNDSPVLYIETSEQTPPTFLEQMERTKVKHENPKPATSDDDTDHTQTTPPPPKKRYEIMKIQSFFLHQYTLLQHKPFVVNQTLFILHNIQTFLLHTLMVSICIQDNPILIL